MLKISWNRAIELSPGSHGNIPIPPNAYEARTHLRGILQLLLGFLDGLDKDCNARSMQT